jgi:drug/metabolite transporter (DMT)-like permease
MQPSPASPDAHSPNPAAAVASIDRSPAGGASALIGAAMALSAAIMWGTNGVIASSLLKRGVTPLTLVEARSIIAALGMGGVLLCVGRSRFRVRRRDVSLLLLFGLSLAIVTYAYFLAVQYLPVAVAVMIQYTGPTLIALYTALTLRRLPPPRIWLALGLTLVGIALLAGLADLLGGSSARGVTLLGVVIAFASAVTMAFYMLVGERLGKRLHPQTSVFYGFALAALLWLMLQPPWRFQTAALAPDALPLVLAVGIIGTLIPFGLFLAAINRLDATRAAILATVEPVTATLLSWVLLGQPLDAWQVLGALLVLIGVTVVQLKR